MKRRLARELAVQCLYQMEMTGVTAGEALETLFQEAKEDNETGIALSDEDALRVYVEELVSETRRMRQVIDSVMSGYLKGWKMERLSRVDRQILRLAVYEMTCRDDVPPKAAINEAIELAKHFGTEESGKFVNGVLGQMIRELDAVRERVRTGRKDEID